MNFMNWCIAQRTANARSSLGSQALNKSEVEEMVAMMGDNSNVWDMYAGLCAAVEDDKPAALTL